MATYRDFQDHPDQPKFARAIADRIRLHSKGENDTILSRQIEHRFQISGPQLRDTIHWLRMQGCPICSSNEGYWWATSAADLESTILHGQQRANSIHHWVNGLKRTQARLLAEENPPTAEQEHLNFDSKIPTRFFEVGQAHTSERIN